MQDIRIDQVDTVIILNLDHSSLYSKSREKLKFVVGHERQKLNRDFEKKFPGFS